MQLLKPVTNKRSGLEARQGGKITPQFSYRFIPDIKKHY